MTARAPTTLALGLILSLPRDALASPAPQPISALPAFPLLLLALGLAAGLLFLFGEASCDVEELERLRSILQISRNKLKAVFDSLKDPTISITTGGVVESVNMAAARRADAHPRELVGLSYPELLERGGGAPETAAACRDAFEQMLERQTPQYRMVELEGPEGPEHYEISVVPAFDQRGELNLGIIQLKDVTIFKRMEQTVREYSHSLEAKVAERTRDLLAMQEDLKAQRDRLSQANSDLLRLEQLRHDLTNMVVHDMKGPLAEVMGNLELLGFGQLDETQQEAMDLATMGADDLLRMIMNLLDIDRLEEGRLRVNYGLVVFKDLAGAVIHRFSTLIRLKDLTVTVSDRADGPFSADPELLSRVVQNLLTNALSHTPEGGRIELAVDKGEDDGVVISVADNGEGIPERYHQRIFRKFTQASDGRGPRTSTGLGLTFCKMAVGAHQGRIWFQSQEGQGTTFFVWLPRRPDDDSDL